MRAAFCFRAMAPLLSSVAAKLRGLLRAFLLWVLSAGPIPAHIAIIMDGNRRFADRLRMDRRIGHSHGYESLMRTLKDCFDLRVKTVTLYAFSIDNFKRPPEEVSALMDLMQTKLETLIEKEDLVREYGVRVRVLGDLSLLPDAVRKAAERAMAVTSQNSSAVLNLCISYTSTHEIVHSVQKIRDDLVSVLGRGGDVDVSQKTLDSGSMGICDFKENDWPMITCNGHALGPHMAWDDDVSNGDYGHANGSCKDVGNGDYGHANGSCKDVGNGDHGHANGSLEPCDNGVDNGDYEHANDFLKAWDDSVHNCGCVQVKGYCNAWDGDVGNGDHVHANGYCKEWDGALGNGDNGHANQACDDGVNNSDYDHENVECEMRSQNSAGKIDSREIRSFGSTDCKSMQSNVLRNRIFKKARLSGICNPVKSGFLHDGDQELTDTTISWDDLKICDCKDFGLLENCVNGSKKAFKNCHCMGTGSSGDIDCGVVGKSRATRLNKAWHVVDCKCKTNGPKKASNGLRNCDIFNSPSKLAGLRKRLCESTDSCPHVGLSTDGILENGLPMSCKCGQQCHIDDRILKLVQDRISEKEIERHLYTDSCPPPDILIRTSGETRLSNFLLWQASFSHLAFSKVLWPEFSFRHLFFIILEYQRAHSSLLRKRQWCSKAS